MAGSKISGKQNFSRFTLAHLINKMSPSKVALITGASKGVGAAIARALANDMRVVVNYRSDSVAAETLIQELNGSAKSDTLANGGGHLPRFATVKGDMANREDIDRIVNITVQKMGRLDVVVSNVGWTRMSDFFDLSDAANGSDWDRCFEMNVKSHFFLFDACKTHLTSSKGVFIATASVAGVKPSGSSLVSASIRLWASITYFVYLNLAVCSYKGRPYSPHTKSCNHICSKYSCELSLTWCFAHSKILILQIWISH